MAISTTVVEIVSTSQEFSLPGDVSAASFVSSYGQSIAGLATMASEESVDGTTKHLVFRLRTGTKG